MVHRQVAHVWANQSKTHSNRNSNLYFEGATIFSYGPHFPIATHTANAQGERAILATTDGYSSSTSKHIGYVRSAINDLGVPVFYVPLRSGNYIAFAKPEDATLADSRLHRLKEFFDAYLVNAAKCMDKASRARTYKASWQSEALGYLNEANRFAEFFGIEDRAATSDLGPMLENIREEAAKEDERKREQRESARIVAAEQFEEWQAGTRTNCPKAYSVDTKGSAYLRAITRGSENIVQTSRGAEVLFEEARKAFRFVKLCRMTGRVFAANGSQVPVGHFRLNTIDAEGNVKIGCHNFTWERIEEFAKRVGFFEDAGSTEALVSEAHA